MLDKIKNLFFAVVSLISCVTTIFLPKSSSSPELLKNPTISHDSIIKICDENIRVAEEVAKNSSNEEAIHYAEAVINENRNYKQKIINTN